MVRFPLRKTSNIADKSWCTCYQYLSTTSPQPCVHSFSSGQRCFLFRAGTGNDVGGLLCLLYATPLQKHRVLPLKRHLISAREISASGVKAWSPKTSKPTWALITQFESRLLVLKIINKKFNNNHSQVFYKNNIYRQVRRNLFVKMWESALYFC